MKSYYVDEAMKKKPETIFSSDDVDVKFYHGKSDICFVTFTSLGLRHQEGFGERLFVSRDVSAFYFISKWNHWYQPSSVMEAARLVREILVRQGYSKVVTYGASMGGYGAAAYAGMLSAHQIIMLAPQYTIQPSKPPYERRWTREANKIDFTFDDLCTQMGKASKVVIYDPLSADHGHAALFAETSNCTLLPVPFCGHTPGRILLHCGLLQNTLMQLVDGSFDRATFLSILHRGRRTHYEYWATIADFAQKRTAGRSGLRQSRLAFALHALQEGLRLSPEQSSLALQSAYLLLQLNRIPEAVASATLSVDLAREHPASWRALSVALRQSGDFPGALEAARKAVALRSNDADLRRVLTQTLLSMKLYNEALIEGCIAIGLDPACAESYAFLGSALRHLGRVSEAIVMHEQALARKAGVPAWSKQLDEMRAIMHSP